jgi:TP901-1 family phage major tail protein
VTAQQGKALLLKLDPTGSGTFVTIAGLRSRKITLTAPAVDATHADSPSRWQELLGAVGVRKCAVSGSGVFLAAGSDASIQTIFFNNTTMNLQIVVPGSGTIAGPFQITSLDYTGDHNNELTFDIALESAGAITFTAGA